VGPDYPVDPSKWRYEGPCTGRKAAVVFDNSIPNGAEVWICAAWLNQKLQAGPTSIPLSTNLQGGGSDTEAA
jgi:hypothetical protein